MKSSKSLINSGITVRLLVNDSTGELVASVSKKVFQDKISGESLVNEVVKSLDLCKTGATNKVSKMLRQMEQELDEEIEHFFIHEELSTKSDTRIFSFKPEGQW